MRALLLAVALVAVSAASKDAAKAAETKVAIRGGEKVEGGSLDWTTNMQESFDKAYASLETALQSDAFGDFRRYAARFEQVQENLFTALRSEETTKGFKEAWAWFGANRDDIESKFSKLFSMLPSDGSADDIAVSLRRVWNDGIKDIFRETDWGSLFEPIVEDLKKGYDPKSFDLSLIEAQTPKITKFWKKLMTALKVDPSTKAYKKAALFVKTTFETFEKELKVQAEVGKKAQTGADAAKYGAAVKATEEKLDESKKIATKVIEKQDVKGEAMKDEEEEEEKSAAGACALSVPVAVAAVALGQLRWN